MISFLHTAATHIPTFDALLDELSPGMERQHRVEEGWLNEAREKGMSPALHTAISDAMGEMASGGIGVCTCSSIGGAAESAHSSNAPVIRIDRALMEKALSYGPKPLVAMCLESTRAPTLELLQDVASKVGVVAAPEGVMCDGAWAHFEAADMTAYGASITASVRWALDNAAADCVVLAQGSMAVAEPLLADAGVPVLSSPRLGVMKALELLRSR